MFYEHFNITPYQFPVFISLSHPTTKGEGVHCGRLLLLHYYFLDKRKATVKVALLVLFLVCILAFLIFLNFG